MYGYLTPVGGGDPFPLTKKEIIVGRHKSSDIILNFTNVSGNHCKLVLSEGYWYILDLQSTNGVKVNGHKVTDRRVDPGAVLAISKHMFKLQYDPRQNGATGLPPDSMLHGDEILSQSLMQRAGLEKAKSPETVSDAVLEIVSAEEPAEPVPQEPSPVAQHSPRDYFGELVFD
jgi:adenylate cyclase